MRKKDYNESRMMNRQALHEYIANQQPNICQIAAYRDNAFVYSDAWNNFNETDCVHVASVTKSVIALLVGTAIDKGQIRSVDDKVLGFFPDYKVKRGERTIYDVTIRHLLTMRAPYKCKGDPWSKVCASENWTISSLDFLGGRKGLTDEFNYQTVCLHILSGILYQATGMKTADYANAYLFRPLGIQNRGYQWNGKRVFAFATSGSSGIGRTAEKLAPHVKGAASVDAKLVHTAEEVKEWVRL